MVSGMAIKAQYCLSSILLEDFGNLGRTEFACFHNNSLNLILFLLLDCTIFEGSLQTSN